MHNVRLVTKDGREVPLRLDQDGIWQVDDIALLDFENKVATVQRRDDPHEHNGTRRGASGGLHGRAVRPWCAVQPGNHANQAVAPSPLNLTGLFWSWQDGYKFLRIDTAFDNLRVHLGSTGCEYGPTPGIVASCARPNRADVNLDGFNPATNVIVADLRALLANSDLNANDPDTPPGCMSDPDDQDCDPIFTNLGLHASDGTPSPATQKFFRVE